MFTEPAASPQVQARNLTRFHAAHCSTLNRRPDTQNPIPDSARRAFEIHAANRRRGRHLLMVCACDSWFMAEVWGSGLGMRITCSTTSLERIPPSTDAFGYARSAASLSVTGWGGRSWGRGEGRGGEGAEVREQGAGAAGPAAPAPGVLGEGDGSGVRRRSDVEGVGGQQGRRPCVRWIW